MITKDQIKRLRKIASVILKQVEKGDWDLSYLPGIGNCVVAKGSDHVIATVFGGLYNETPIENACAITLSKNHIHEFISAFLELAALHEK